MTTSSATSGSPTPGVKDARQGYSCGNLKTHVPYNTEQRPCLPAAFERTDGTIRAPSAQAAYNSNGNVSSVPRFQIGLVAEEVVMKLIVKISGAVFVCIVLLLVTLHATGFEPRECTPGAESWSCRAPGLWLKGEVVATPVSDWSFTDKFQTIKIQTQTPILLPYSVSIWCAVRIPRWGCTGLWSNRKCGY